MSVAAFSVTSKLTNSEFDQLFREHYQLVYRTAFSVTPSRPRKAGAGADPIPCAWRADVSMRCA